MHMHGEQDGEHAPETRPPLFGQALLKVAHRPTEDVAVAADLSIHLAEGALGELGRHTEEASDDHPEDRAGAAHGDCDCHACDVAEADRRGEGGRQRLEVSHFAGVVRIVVPACRDHPCVLERAQVDEAKAEGEEDRTRDQPDDDEGQLDLAVGPVVPKRQIEEQHGGDRPDDVGPKPCVEGLQYAADAAFGRVGPLRQHAARRKARPQGGDRGPSCVDPH